MKETGYHLALQQLIARASYVLLCVYYISIAIWLMVLLLVSNLIMEWLLPKQFNISSSYIMCYESWGCIYHSEA